MPLLDDMNVPLYVDPAARWASRFCTKLGLGLALALILAAGLATPADAQLRRGRQVGPAPEPRPPITLGLRGGYDREARGEVLGAYATVPFLGGGKLSLMPGADVTFVTGSKEYQYALELVYVSGGREGGLFGGGGVGYRHTVFGTNPGDPRDRRLAYTLVVGVRSASGGSIQTQLALRWVFLQGLTYRPTPISLGISFPLWGRS